MKCGEAAVCVVVNLLPTAMFEWFTLAAAVYSREAAAALFWPLFSKLMCVIGC